MVTILPPAYSDSAYIGQGIGSGIERGLSRGSDIALNRQEQRYQRGMLQEALGGLTNLPVETTPGQLAQKLMMATAGIPGAERYVAPLYQSLLADIQSRQSQKAAEIAQATQREQETTGIPGGKQRPLTKEALADLLGEQYFPNVEPAPEVGSPESLKPQKPLVPPKPIGPAEESMIRKELFDVGVKDPKLQDKLIADTRQFQTDTYAAQKEGFKNIEDYQNARRERDQNFFQESMIPLQAAHGTMTPNEMSMWQELSREYEDLPNSERYLSTEQKYNQVVGNPIIQFENNVQGLPLGSILRPGEVKNRMDFARNSVQDHLKSIDDRKELSPNLKGIIKNHLRDKYFNSMVSKDYGISQAAYAVSNLSDATKAAIPMAPKPIHEAFEDVYLANPQERDKMTYALANALTKIKPDDSLLLFREKALQNNFDDKAFMAALNIAEQSGRLKFSDYQRNERTKLSIPQRLDLDSIMEGKRNFWDLFKGKQ